MLSLEGLGAKYSRRLLPWNALRISRDLIETIREHRFLYMQNYYFILCVMQQLSADGYMSECV